jgi:hypothetical protein
MTTKVKLPTGQTRDDHIRSAWESAGHTVEELFFCKGAFYAAVRLGTRGYWPYGDAGAITAFVIVCYREGQNTCFRCFHEGSEPGYYDAPRIVLEKLTPLSPFISPRWRKACWKRVKALAMTIGEPVPRAALKRNNDSPCNASCRVPSEEYF